MTNQELMPPEPKIIEYREYHAQLAELMQSNSTAVFDYRDPKGNKEARSHIYKLRQTKSAVDKKRKEIKAEVLERGRFIDSEAKDIIGCIESMIELHETPIKAIEAEEAERVANHQANIETLRSFQAHNTDSTSVEINDAIERLACIVVDESYQEFMAEASSVKKQAMQYLNDLFVAAKKKEEERAELERLRQEQAKREQEEREARIAAEAKAQAEAEAKRQAEEHARQLEAQKAAAKAEAERKEREAAEAIARAEREKQEAIAQAEAQAKAAAEQAERARQDEIRRQQEERARIQREAEAREANKRHVGAIRKAAKEALMTECRLTEDQAKSVVMAINSGKIPSVKINY